MEVDTHALFGGNLGWGRITQKQVSQHSGVSESVISQVKTGKAGFGPAAAKSVAKTAGYNAADLYVASQVRSAKKRMQTGELDNAGAVRVVEKVVGELRESFSGEEISKEVAEDLGGFVDNLEEAQELDASYRTAAIKSRRDGFGRKIEQKETTAREEPDAAAKSVPGTYGALGRNADGTSRRRVV